MADGRCPAAASRSVGSALGALKVKGQSSALGVGWSKCPFPVHGGCASPKAAGRCTPRNVTSMLAKLFANDVRATQAVVEPCCKVRLLNRKGGLASVRHSAGVSHASAIISAASFGALTSLKSASSTQH